MQFDLLHRVEYAAKIDFVPVPAGRFTMGSPPSECGRYPDETQHEVTISKPFLMSRTPVTEAQYAAVTGQGPSSDLPIVNISWHEAIAFCEKLSAKIGKTVRLPTEAEWEYACRAGTTEATYGPIDETAWHRGSCDARRPVGLKKPNAFGLHDMLGNVWEWCSDRYGGYPQGPVTDPQGPPEGEHRVLRGGSWYDTPTNARSAYRYRDTPDDRDNLIGFRVVLVGG